MIIFELRILPQQDNRLSSTNHLRILNKVQLSTTKEITKRTIESFSQAQMKALLKLR